MDSVWLDAALLLPKRRLWVRPLPKCQSTVINGMLVALDGRQPPQALLPGELDLRDLDRVVAAGLPGVLALLGASTARNAGQR